MQPALARARVLDRVDLGPQVIRAQEIVADPQLAGGVAL
jgi:hypothetical protein